MRNGTKKVNIVGSERNDSWLDEVEVSPGETILEALRKHGYENFRYIGADIDQKESIKDGTNLRIRLM
jgi:hypothetical protein